MNKKVALIIGAGPAGLTAAYELLKHTDIVPFVFETTNDIGGLAKTVDYKGNKIDIGGHRFFSKSDEIMDWWLNFMPIQDEANDPDKTDNVMLIKKRKSRIFYMRKLFDYPISISLNTINNLGVFKLLIIGFSYAKILIFPIKNESNLEEFFINRFGKELYNTFFKSYTEKVWGLKCTEISAEWGKQRIKGLSIKKAIFQAIINIFNRKSTSLKQKETETSLISQFLYPKFGPGQLWTNVANYIEKNGGFIKKNHSVIQLYTNKNNYFESAKIKDNITGKITDFKADYFLSSMSVQDMVLGLDNLPDEVLNTAKHLKFRDFITIGLLLKNIKIDKKSKEKMISDNWIYIQEPDVKVGRLQIFNNWSKYLVKNQDHIWIGLEYFCNVGDALWNLTDAELKELASSELVKMNMINQEDVLDSVVIRFPKAYPVYFGAYENFKVIRDYINKFPNLFPIGRNGMYRYNNMDHSMLSSMTAVRNIKNGETSKDNIWEINTEDSYHEKK